MNVCFAGETVVLTGRSTTNTAIDKRVYGLTEEEIAIVEGNEK